MERIFMCEMCYFKARNVRQLICHSLVKHRNDGNFMAFCPVGNCFYSTSSWNAYKLHISRKHKNINIEAHLNESVLRYFADQRVHGDMNNGSDDDSMDMYSPNENEVCFIGQENEQHNKSYLMSLAKYFLSLETEHKLSQVSLNQIAESNKALLKTTLSNVLHKVEKLLIDLGERNEVVKDAILDLRTQTEADIFVTSNRFCNEANRALVYNETCNIVKPECIVLGKKYSIKNGKKFAHRLCGYYIPMKKQIERLLNLDEFWFYYRNPHISSDGLYRDVCDGSFVKTHVLNNDPKNFLKIGFSFDDVELQNPLRPTQRHKLAFFYFQILNIPVQFRSRLKTIFLVAVARSKHVQKYGLDRILQDFTSTMNCLEQRGLDLNIQGMQHNVKGCLLYCICDNLAAAFLGGFKEGSAFAKMPCRMCDADRDTFKVKFKESDFVLRTKDRYLEQCDTIHNRELEKGQYTFWSREFGINRKSVLCKIENFPITSNLLMDTMHVLSEGLCCYLLALFLNRCCIEYKIFTLDWLNNEVQKYPFHYVDAGHKPERISRKHIAVDLYIKQKAVAMNSLMFCIPHILGGCFPNYDPYYEHLIKLVQICQLCFTPYADSDTVADLERLINDFCTKWTTLYPHSSVKPKCHFLIHIPSQIRRFGSLHGVSCLRYESKHFWFKDMRIRNYKNLPYSLAMKHQLYLAHKTMDAYGHNAKNFVYTGDEIGEGDTVIVSCASPGIYPLLCAEFGIFQQFELYEPKEITLQGLNYSLGTILLIGWEDDMCFPLFGCIEATYVKDGKTYFLVTKLVTDCYKWQYNSYVVSWSDELILLKWTSIQNKFPLFCYKKDGYNLVMNRNSHKIGFA